MLDVNLMINNSEKNRIGKKLTGSVTYQCSLKEDCSIMDPVIMLNTSGNMHTFNYMYIPAFQRYYFIVDVTSKGNNLWEITAHADVLETYKDKILANSCILERQTNFYNSYLNDEEYPVYSYDDVITFRFTDSEFIKNMKFILTVAGGA